MGLLRNRDDAPKGPRFQMQDKLASIGDDAWIEDDQGDRRYYGIEIRQGEDVPLLLAITVAIDKMTDR